MCRWFSTISGAVAQALELAFLSCYYLPWLWDTSDALTWHLAKRVSWLHHSEIAVTIVFFLLDSAKDTVLGLPFSLYSTFIVEQKHGFNKQTLRLFALDVVKSVRTH